MYSVFFELQAQTVFFFLCLNGFFLTLWEAPFKLTVLSYSPFVLLYLSLGLNFSIFSTGCSNFKYYSWQLTSRCFISQIADGFLRVSVKLTSQVKSNVNKCCFIRLLIGKKIASVFLLKNFGQFTFIKVILPQQAQYAVSR